jgi:hypothetical protein
LLQIDLSSVTYPTPVFGVEEHAAEVIYLNAIIAMLLDWPVLFAESPPKSTPPNIPARCCR